ncbi:hypothetical protein C8F04DRAFT_1101820 [Mycena alexandri]|uniref:Uncharacterized protein n=1 Tax=Mycena alexandri TaxID=1745969 RepID=A0AAD6X4D0_9AGAR|nr:hypothetical protein C8F04DRAFT_1101820 [Mycena alexandri]
MSRNSLPPRPSSPSPNLSSATFRLFKVFPSRSSKKSDWLRFSISAAKTATAATELAPFPFIKVAFGMVVTLLEALEKLQKNQEDLKDLCGNIDEIVDILRDQISRHGDTAAVKLKGHCEEFESILRDILQTVERMQKRSHFNQFIKSTSISADIVAYEKRITGLLSRIMLIAGLDGAFDVADIRSQVQDIHAIISPSKLATVVSAS